MKPDTCPYCGAPYTISYGGCRDKCPEMRAHAALVAEAADADVTEEDEVMLRVKSREQ